MAEINIKQIDILLHEYEALKKEQLQRIQLRDYIIYLLIVTTGIVVSVFSRVPNSHFALLLIPWFCLLLGWIYLVNDQKISEIGIYIRTILAEKLMILTKEKDSIFDWELQHKNDSRRKERKILQYFIDLIAFVIPGIIAIVIFLLYEQNQPYTFIDYLAISEIILLLFMGYQITVYADFTKGK